jgi:hypothetical protein
LLKLLFFAFILIFSLKLLIFGGQLVATENNHGTFSVVFIFGGQVTATDNKSLFSAASEPTTKNELFSVADTWPPNITANFLWRPETSENRPKAAENKLFSAANTLFSAASSHKNDYRCRSDS